MTTRIIVSAAVFILAFAWCAGFAWTIGFNFDVRGVTANGIYFFGTVLGAYAVFMVNLVWRK